jgi:hypothetical protein
MPTHGYGDARSRNGGIRQELAAGVKESPNCLCRGFQGGVSSAQGSRYPGRPDTILRHKSRKARIANNLRWHRCAPSDPRAIGKIP